MKCPYCETELIWGNDFDIDDDLEGREGVLSFWTCPDCSTEIEVRYYDKPD